MMRHRRLFPVLFGGGAWSGFTDEFTRGDGDLANSWDYTAGLWTVSSNSAVGAPALTGGDVITNGPFAADTDWTKGTNWSIAAGVAARTAGVSGTITATVPPLTAKKWFYYTFDVVTLTAGEIYASIGGALWGGANTTTGAKIITGYAADGNCGLYGNTSYAGTSDNITAQQIVTADMFCTRDLTKSNVDISVPITLSAGKSSGVVLCLDSVATPANYILAFHDGLYGRLAKVVSGTLTALVTASAAYGAGRVLRVVKSGTSVSLYYNGSQVGTTQTVSDAGIKDNTRHGLFTTYSGNSFSSFTAVAA